jgi:F-type H+-transporting ATPase subunit delta
MGIVWRCQDYKISKHAVHKRLERIAEQRDLPLTITRKQWHLDSKVSDEDREKTLIKIAGKKLNAYGENLIKLLIEYKRLNVLPQISELFETLKATDEGTLDAEIIVASKPTDKEVDTLVKSLEKKFNKKIDAKVTIDEAIIGGIKVIVGDTVIDASVREQLQNLAYALKS